MTALTAAVAQAHAANFAGNVAAEAVRIDLGDGHFAVIDAVDAGLVAGYRWRYITNPAGRLYAAAWHKGRTVYMHRIIAGTPDGMTTDHINRDTLDNRRSNLRKATWQQNSFNTAKRWKYGDRGAPTSRYKGVSWDREKGRWHARAKIDGRVKFLGRYDDEAEAARAYDAEVFASFGEFAELNFPDRIGEPSPYKPGRKKPPPRTHCPQRHEYTPENSRFNKHGHRVCVTCTRQKDLARWRRRRDAARDAQGQVAA